MRSFRAPVSFFCVITFLLLGHAWATDDIAPAANFTFNAPSGATNINIVDGPVISNVQTTAINDGGTGKFATYNFANKTSVTINAGSGVNAVVINNPKPAAGLTNLTVNGGGQLADVITVAGPLSLSGIITLANTGGAINVNTGASITAPGGVRITAGTTLTLNGKVSAPSGSIGLSAGGTITQAVGAPLSATNLLLLAGGPVTLANPSNSVNYFSANVTNSVSYLNAGNLTLAALSIGGFGSAPGVNTINTPIDIGTVNGTVGVNQPVDAGTSTVILTAGSASGADNFLTLNSSVSGTGGVTLVGDHMNLLPGGASVNAGSQIAVLKPFDHGTVIDLGGSTSANRLGLLNQELAKVTADILRVRDPADTGGLTVSAPISQGPNYTTLSLLNGGDITESGSGVLTQTNLGVRGRSVTLDNVSNAISNIGGLTTGPVSVAFLLNNNVPLNIADVDTFAGLTAGQGEISVTNNGTIALTSIKGLEAVLGGSSGDVELVANGQTADIVRSTDGDAITNPGGAIVVEAGRDVLLGTAGSDFDNDVRANRVIILAGQRDVVIDGFSDVASDDFANNTGAGVVVFAGRNLSISANKGDDASVGANGTGLVTLTAGPNSLLSLTVPNPSAVFSQGGSVTVTADRVLIDNSSGITAPAGVVSFQQNSSPWSVDIGSTTDSAGSALELSSAELDRVFSPTVQVGSLFKNGSIFVTAAITATNYSTLVLQYSQGGAITGPGKITVPNLTITYGGTVAHTFDIGGGANPTFQDSFTPVPFAASNLTVNGGSGQDAFEVTALPATQINLNGNDPTVAPGDVLNYNAEGRVVGGDGIPPNGSMTSPGVKPVSFQNIEAVHVSNFTPSIYINDVTVNEGNTGATTDAIFTVSLVAASSSTVAVDFFTSPGTATEGTDYGARNGTRTFMPGETTKTITVPVFGDTTPEKDETYFVNLSDPSNAVIGKNKGTGTIKNDDGPIPSPTPTPKPTPTATPKATATATPKATATATPKATATATPKATATATPKATATATPKATATATPKATATATPKATATATPKATATPTATPGLVANVSTRLPVGTGDNALIEGFIIQGPSGSIKKILVRAIGPSLKPFGIPDALANPTLGIFNSNNTKIASNDNWKTTQVGGIITSSQVTEIKGSGLAPSNDLESAIIANLTPASYTAVVRGAGNGVGTGVVDAFDLSTASTARVANISTRGLIQPGDKLMIAGFIVQKGSVRVVISAIGPSLTAFGIPNALPDTTLQLRNQNGVIVRENDDWMTTQKQELENTGLQPGNPKEAALVQTIPPGQYTAEVRGKPETTGIGVVQIYFLQ